MPRIASARLTLGSAVGLLLLSVPAAAMELPIDPAVGRYQRALRSVQSQAATNPDAAAREAAQLRRQMINENGGVNFTPDQARINRDLQAVEDMGRGDLDQAADPAADGRHPAPFDLRERRRRSAQHAARAAPDPPPARPRGPGHGRPGPEPGNLRLSRRPRPASRPCARPPRPPTCSRWPTACRTCAAASPACRPTTARAAP